MLSHKPVLSVITVTISVLSMIGTPLSAGTQSIQGSQCPGSAVLQSSSVGWSGYGLKQECRQAERQWLKSKLTVHKQMYDSIKQKIRNLVDKAK